METTCGKGAPYDVCLDKGTYDAICLCADDVDVKKQRYVDNVYALTKDEGLFIITSCNWTREELLAQFQHSKLWHQCLWLVDLYCSFDNPCVWLVDLYCLFNNRCVWLVRVCKCCRILIGRYDPNTCAAIWRTSWQERDSCGIQKTLKLTPSDYCNLMSSKWRSISLYAVCVICFFFAECNVCVCVCEFWREFLINFKTSWNLFNEQTTEIFQQ